MASHTQAGLWLALLALSLVAMQSVAAHRPRGVASAVEAEAEEPVQQRRRMQSELGSPEEEQMVCFNDCSGHGECVNWQCECHPGWSNEDCSVAIVDTNTTAIPLLSAGHTNLTRANFTGAKRRHDLLFVAYSSPSCERCIAAELELAQLEEPLRELGILFARVNVDRERELAEEAGIVNLPAVRLWRKRKMREFEGALLAQPLLHWLSKQAGPPAQQLNSVRQVEQFVRGAKSDRPDVYSTVVAFFSDVDEQDGEREEFFDMIDVLQAKHDLFFAEVTDETVCQLFKERGWIRKAGPAAMLTKWAGEDAHEDDHERVDVDLEGFYGEGSLKHWVLKNNLPHVGPLTPSNFNLYDSLARPMLMIMLDPADKVGNMYLLQDAREATRDFRDRISVVHADGVEFGDKMVTLGLFGGTSALPAMAWNTRDRRILPFDQTKEITRDAIRGFVVDFLAGRLIPRKLEHLMAAAKARHDAMLAAADAQARATQPGTRGTDSFEEITGIQERFHGTEAIQVVSSANYSQIALDDTSDVLLLIYKEHSLPCAQFAVYYKRVAERFAAMDGHSVVVARMDVENDVPPSDIQLLRLPTIVLLPAYDKEAPFRYYSGMGKVLSLIRWVHKHASIPFELPELPQLRDGDVALYKEQIREREKVRAERAAAEAKAAERMEKQAALQAAARAQEEEAA